MTVAISHYPCSRRHRGSPGIKLPPECVCPVTLLERKFISASGPPPLVDADRLGRGLNLGRGTKRTHRICVYCDRLIFQACYKDDDLPDIFYDDVMQLEQLDCKYNILFILCGRRGIGVYYFFKFSDCNAIDCIKRLAFRRNPCLNSDGGVNTFLWKSMQQPRLQNKYEFGNHRMNLSDSASLSTLSDCSIRASRSAHPRQNSFVKWNGYNGTRNKGSGHNPRNRSVEGEQFGQGSIRTASHKRPKNTEKTSFIQIEASLNSTKTKPSQSKHKIVLDESRPILKSSGRSLYKTTDRGENRKYPQQIVQDKYTYKSPKPQTFNRHNVGHEQFGALRYPSSQLNGMESSDSDYSFANEVQTGRYRKSGGPQLSNTLYQRGNMENHDWEGIDRYDTVGSNLRKMNLNAYDGGHGDFFSDMDSSTSEDSLYLEREQQISDYSPEFQRKFRNFYLK